MFKFTDDERCYLNEMRAITTDTTGNEVLVGLNLEETKWYMKYSRDFLSGNQSSKNKNYYLELHEKHEKARLEILGAEIYIRNESPLVH